MDQGVLAGNDPRPDTYEAACDHFRGHLEGPAVVPGSVAKQWLPKAGCAEPKETCNAETERQPGSRGPGLFCWGWESHWVTNHRMVSACRATAPLGHSSCPGVP